MATKRLGTVTHVICNDCGARDDGWNQGGGLTPCEICGPKALDSGQNLSLLYLVCQNCRAKHFLAKHPEKP
jgi:hypothetical protein